MSLQRMAIVATLLAATTTTSIAGESTWPDARIERVREALPNARGCIPGPHEPGRMRRQVGQAVTSAAPWALAPSTDQYPHCRFDSQEEADRDRLGY